MIIKKATEKIKCSKCDNWSDYIIQIDNKIYGACELHKPSTMQILRAQGHIISLKNKEYVLFSGLLNIAHQSGLKSIKTKIIEFDYEDKFCLVEATVEGDRGIYIGHGDADSSNVSKKILSAFIRMAETRAIARALRFYTGLGMTCAEELPPQN